MSLNFTNAGDVVKHGTAVGTFTACSWCGWIYPTSLAVLQNIWSKKSDSDTTQAPSFFTNSNDELRLSWRGSTNMAYETSAANLTTNKWWFVGVTVDQGASAGAKVKVYVGDLATIAASQSFATATDGATFRTNASTEFRIGSSVADDSPWKGRIANTLFWPGVVLTQAEIQLHQFLLRPRVAGCKVAAVYGYNGTGTQADWSGNANNGTVTGATVADHVPVTFRSGRVLYVPYAVAAVAGGKPWLYYARQRGAA